MNETLSAQVHKKFPHYVEMLKDLIRIPSISFDNFDQNEVVRSAEHVKMILDARGFVNAQFLVPESGRPSVFAELKTRPENPTVLLYAHHDVQPTMRKALWKSAPFEPEIRNGRLYGRGAADDKSGIVLHVAAVSEAFMLCGNKMPNIKFLIEGEEECGSSGFGKLLEKNKELLKADAVIIADLSNFATGVPSLTTSLRGMSALSVTVRSIKSPLHSGSWSGPIPDPVQALCKLIASLTDKDGNILVEHFNDGITAPSAEERQSYEALHYTEETFRKEAGLLPSTRIYGDKNSILETLWRKPSLVVTAFEAGSRTQAGNVLQDSAYARIGIRLAPGMDTERSTKLLKEHLEKNLPDGLSMEILAEDGANPFTTDVSHPYYTQMKKAMTEAYGTEAKFIGCGASIPGAQLFRNTLGDIPILMTGLEDPECNAHGENESLGLLDFEHGILAEALFLEGLCK